MVAGQEIPQPPQFVAVLVGVSHPSTSFDTAEQLAKPDVHAAWGTTHPPLLQLTLAVLLMCPSTVQLLPQVPQFVGSVVLLTHFDTHKSGVGLTQLDAQAGVPLVVEHNAVGATQVLVQLPQVAGLVRSVSQPASALVEQCPKPDTHPAGWITHTPDTHWTAGDVAPGFTLVSAVQS